MSVLAYGQGHLQPSHIRHHSQLLYLSGDRKEREKKTASVSARILKNFKLLLIWEKPGKRLCRKILIKRKYESVLRETVQTANFNLHTVDCNSQIH